MHLILTKETKSKHTALSMATSRCHAFKSVYLLTAINCQYLSM